MSIAGDRDFADKWGTRLNNIFHVLPLLQLRNAKFLMMHGGLMKVSKFAIHILDDVRGNHRID